MLWIALAIIAMAMTETAVAKPHALKRAAADNYADDYYIMATGKLYFYHAKKMNFADAKAYCRGRGGNLASINTIAHFKRISTEIQHSKMELWVGAEYDSTAKHWRWLTGEAFPVYGVGFKWHWPDSRPFTDDAGSTKAMFIHGDGNNGFCKPAPKTQATRGALCEFNLGQDQLDGTIKLHTPNVILTRARDKMFFYHAVGMTFDDARKYCKARGGDLASIDNIAQFSKVNDGIQGAGKELWVGAEYDSTAQHWRWFTGEEFPIYGKGFVLHHSDQIPFKKQGTDVAGPTMGMFIHGDSSGGNIGKGFCGPAQKSTTTRGALCEVVLKP